MSNLPETNNFDTGVYELETTDLLLGGPSGVMNTAPKNLTNRTRWLYNQVQSILATLAGLLGANNTWTGTNAFSGAVTVPAASASGNPVQLGQFVSNRASPGYITLPDGTIIQWGVALLPASGGTTSSITFSFPIAFPSGCYELVGNAIATANSVNGYFPALAATNATATQGTFVGDTLTGNSGSPVNFDQAIFVRYLAVGR